MDICVGAVCEPAVRLAFSMSVYNLDNFSKGTRKPRPWVVKVGGRLVDDPSILAQLARACADAERPLVVIHGGGAQVTALQEKFGIEAKFVEGRRFTPPEEMAIVEMALNGMVNPMVVRALLQEGAHAVGMSGCDARMVTCERIASLGAVGTPTRVHTELLETLLAADFIPVISSVCMAADGLPVNVNADELACAVAAALEAERLLLLSDVPGVRVAGEVQCEIWDADIEDLIAAGEITGGMVPKLRSSQAATALGVDEVRIAGFEGEPLDAIGGTSIRARRLRPSNVRPLLREIKGGL